MTVIIKPLSLIFIFFMDIALLNFLSLSRQSNNDIIYYLTTGSDDLRIDWHNPPIEIITRIR